MRATYSRGTLGVSAGPFISAGPSSGGRPPLRSSLPPAAACEFSHRSHDATVLTVDHSQPADQDTIRSSQTPRSTPNNDSTSSSPAPLRPCAVPVEPLLRYAWSAARQLP